MKYKIKLMYENKTYLAEDKKGNKYSVTKNYNIHSGRTDIELICLDSRTYVPYDGLTFGKSPSEEIADEIIENIHTLEEKELTGRII